jgi:hypothetical protein
MSMAAVTVDHGSAEFTELMLRSLLASNDLSHASLTVIRNESGEDGRALRRFAAARGIEVLDSGWSTAERPNTHGDVLRGFVLSRPDAEHYLVLDSDIVFERRDTVAALRSELERAGPGAWAIHARPVPVPGMEPAAGVPDPEVAGTTVHLHYLTASDHLKPPALARQANQVGHFAGPYQRRWYTACLLIRNSPVFQCVVREVGLSTAWILSRDVACGGLYDTLGLASRVLLTHGLRWVASPAEVSHFGRVTYVRERKDRALRRCRELLSAYRATDG